VKKRRGHLPRKSACTYFSLKTEDGMDRYGGGGGASSNTATPGGRGQPYAPPPNTVQKGTVTRIEPYGCFVQLQQYRARGLVHKSQLAQYRVDSVEDAVSLNDTVYVKVVDVQREQDEDSGKVRHRISLSMKFASQDDGTDLDPSGEKAAEDMARRGGGGEGGRGGQGGGDLGMVQNEAATALERNLGSTIGMASAIDPMAAMRSQRGAKVVLRGGAAAASGGVGDGSSGPTFNGYALVDDDEGEPDMPPPLLTAAAAPGAAVEETVKPKGRGRGTTLPAWMTRDEGPVGAPKESDRSRSRSKSDDSSSSSSYDRRRRKKKDSRRDKKSSKHHRSRNRRRSRSRSRSRSRDRDRRKDSRSSRRKERRKDRHDERKHRRRRRSRSRSRSRSHSSVRSNGAGDGQFGSVEEAKALIARLEKEKAGRNNQRQ